MLVSPIRATARRHTHTHTNTSRKYILSDGGVVYGSSVQGRFARAASKLEALGMGYFFRKSSLGDFSGGLPGLSGATEDVGGECHFGDVGFCCGSLHPKP